MELIQLVLNIELFNMIKLIMVNYIKVINIEFIIKVKHIRQLKVIDNIVKEDFVDIE